MALHQTQPGSERKPTMSNTGPFTSLLRLPLLFLLLMGTALSAPRTLLCFGDSLTAGYGLADPSTEAFPAQLEARIRTAGLDWKVVNAGLSGETTAAGLRRVDWVLRQPVDVVLLALGANDGLRGIEPAVSRRNLEDIIARVRAKFPAAVIVLAGMQLPPSYGEDYVRAFSTIFPEVAKATGAAFVPFLLDGVGGRAELNQADEIHPNAAGHAIIAGTLWKTLEPLLRKPE